MRYILAKTVFIFCCFWGDIQASVNSEQAVQKQNVQKISSTMSSKERKKREKKLKKEKKKRDKKEKKEQKKQKKEKKKNKKGVVQPTQKIPHMTQADIEKNRREELRAQKQNKMLQPSLIRVTKGEIEQATFNGKDITEDLKKLVQYYTYFDKKKWSVGGKFKASNIFQGDPRPGKKKNCNVIFIFSDGTIKRHFWKEKKIKFVSSYQQPLQVLHAQYGKGTKKKSIENIGFDVTWYFQQAGGARIKKDIIKKINNPTLRGRLSELWKSLSRGQVTLKLSGIGILKNQTLKDLSRGWDVETSLSAPGLKRIDPIRNYPQWKPENWSGRVSGRAVSGTWWGVDKEYFNKELEEVKKLPEALQVMVDVEETIALDETPGKKKKNKKEAKRAVSTFKQ